MRSIAVLRRPNSRTSFGTLSEIVEHCARQAVRQHVTTLSWPERVRQAVDGTTAQVQAEVFNKIARRVNTELKNANIYPLTYGDGDALVPVIPGDKDEYEAQLRRIGKTCLGTDDWYTLHEISEEDWAKLQERAKLPENGGRREHGGAYR